MLWALELSQRSHLKWKASYFKHPASHYPVPQTRMALSAAKFMTSLRAESIPKDEGNHYERMGKTLETCEAENRSKRGNEIQSRRSSTSCVREGRNWNMERAFFSRELR